MRGSPPVRVLLIIAALLALLVPLRKLTSHGASVAPAARTVAAGAEGAVHLAITSTAAPFRFQISSLGKVIWKGESTGNSAVQDVALAFPREGIDLLVEVKWDVEKTAAARMDVTAGNGATMSQTLWGEREASDVLTFRKP